MNYFLPYVDDDCHVFIFTAKGKIAEHRETHRDALELMRSAPAYSLIRLLDWSKTFERAGDNPAIGHLFERGCAPDDVFLMDEGVEDAVRSVMYSATEETD